MVSSHNLKTQLFGKLINMLLNFIKQRNFDRKYGKNPTAEQFIEEWSKAPQEYFFGYFEEQLDWTTYYGLAALESLPDTHGYSAMPNIQCQFRDFKYTLDIGYIEDISMHSGGTVRIKHFALNSELTRRGIGKKFFNSILEFFKSNNAVIIEFHENHSSKIEHYRLFFEKNGIREINKGVWRVNLYSKTEIPNHVLFFHEKLLNE